MLKIWNVVLVSLAFCLSIFGTFLTRSGVINSIHSFTQSSIGPWFLGFICLVTVFSVGLILYRLPLLRSPRGSSRSCRGRRRSCTTTCCSSPLCLTILWGVAWPILTEAVHGEARVARAPVLTTSSCGSSGCRCSC